MVSTFPRPDPRGDSGDWLNGITVCMHCHCHWCKYCEECGGCLISSVSPVLCMIQCIVSVRHSAMCPPALHPGHSVESMLAVQGLWRCESSESSGSGSSESAHSLTIPRVSRYIVPVWTVCGREECDGRGVTVVSRHLAELPATGLNQHSDGRVEVLGWPPPPTSSRFTSHSCAGV